MKSSAALGHWNVGVPPGREKENVTFVVEGPTVTARENSEVLLFVSVAVAVTTLPTRTGTGNVAVNDALPFESVLTVVVPRKTSPSP